MPITHDQIEEAVSKCINNVLQVEGREIPKDTLNANTIPVNHLGFDSPDGILFSIELEKNLPISIPYDMNPLVDDQIHKYRNIKEIINLLQTMISENGE